MPSPGKLLQVGSGYHLVGMPFTQLGGATGQYTRIVYLYFGLSASLLASVRHMGIVLSAGVSSASRNRNFTSTFRLPFGLSDEVRTWLTSFFLKGGCFSSPTTIFHGHIGDQDYQD